MKDTWEIFSRRMKTRVKEYRLRHNLTQEKLAEMVEERRRREEELRRIMKKRKKKR